MRNLLPGWAWAAIFGGILLTLFGLTVIGALTLSATAVSGIVAGGVRGHYPPPTTTYRGLTAEGWNRNLMDADYTIAHRAAYSLQALGSEGTPYLLRGIIHFQQTGQREHLKVCVLICSSPPIRQCIAPEDVHIVESSPMFQSLEKEKRQREEQASKRRDEENEQSMRLHKQRVEARQREAEQGAPPPPIARPPVRKR